MEACRSHEWCCTRVQIGGVSAFAGEGAVSSYAREFWLDASGFCRVRVRESSVVYRIIMFKRKLAVKNKGEDGIRVTGLGTRVKERSTRSSE